MIVMKMMMEGVLWVLVLVVVASKPSTITATSSEQFVERLQDGFGHYYMVHGYALADYHLQPTNNSCQCRRWCQSSTVCHSVSVVVREASSGSGGGGGDGDGDGLECRVSNKPVNLNNIKDRPRLIKTPGATHFLSADVSSWVALAKGWVAFHQYNPQSWSMCLTRCPNHPRCSGVCSLASITTTYFLQQAMEVMLDGLNYHVYLVRDGVGQEASWGSDGPGHGTIKLNIILTDLHPSTPLTHYFMRRDGAQITITGTKDNPNYLCLCMDNLLNIQEDL